MTRKEEIEKAAEEYYDEVKYLSDLSAFPIAAFKAGAEWADATMLDKACEWLKENMSNYIIEHPFFPSGSSVTVEEDKMVEDFRKTIEE